MLDYHSPFWLLIFVFCAGGSLWCFRFSIPLILVSNEEHRPGKLETYLPLKGRWLRAGLGACVLLAAFLLATISGMIALFGSLAILHQWLQGT